MVSTWIPHVIHHVEITTSLPRVSYMAFTRGEYHVVSTWSPHGIIFYHILTTYHEHTTGLPRSCHVVCTLGIHFILLFLCTSQTSQVPGTRF